VRSCVEMAYHIIDGRRVYLLQHQGGMLTWNGGKPPGGNSMRGGWVEDSCIILALIASCLIHLAVLRTTLARSYCGPAFVTREEWKCTIAAATAPTALA